MISIGQDQLATADPADLASDTEAGVDFCFAPEASAGAGIAVGGAGSGLAVRLTTELSRPSDWTSGNAQYPGPTNRILSPDVAIDTCTPPGTCNQP